MGTFSRAMKSQARLRLALMGPPGSGKTFSALRIAKGLGGRVAVIDTERASASKYADLFDFDTVNLQSFAPAEYVRCIHAAEAEGFEVLIVDSLSHAWFAKGGALEMVDAASKRSKSGNSYMAWREVTPQHNAMVDAILQSKCHIIGTLRTKTEYVVETVNGKQVPRKVGLAPVQRDGLEYEFDLVGDMDESTMVVTKSRIPSLARQVIQEPGEELGQTLKAWLSDGEPAPEPSAAEIDWAAAINDASGLVDLEQMEPRIRAIASEPLRKAVGSMWNTRRKTLKALESEVRQ